MSLVSINDFVALPQFAWRVYTALRDAPKDYNALSDDVLSLQQVLFRTEDNMTKTKRGLGKGELELLQEITSGCKRILEEVDALLKGCNLTSRGVPWGRIRFAAEDTVQVRSRISAQVDKLNTFNSLLILLSQNRTEEKLDKIIAALERHGSIISVGSMGTAVPGDQGWRTFGRALEDEGVTLQMAQNRHQSLIRLLAAAVGEIGAKNHTAKTTNRNRLFQSSLGVEVAKRSANSISGESTPKLRKEIKNLESGVNKGHVVEESLDKPQSQHSHEVNSSTGQSSPSKRRTLSNSSSSSDVARGFGSRHRRDNASFHAAIEAIAETKRTQSLRDYWSSSIKMSVQYNPIDFENVLRLHPAICVANTIYGQAQRMALRFAALFGIVELLLILLRSDTKMDAQTVSGKIPLHIAIYGDYAEVVKNLLRKNIDMSFRDLRDWLLLHSEGHKFSAPGKSSCAWNQTGTNPNHHQLQCFDCDSSFCVAVLSNKTEAFNLADTEPSTIANDWLDGHGHDLSALHCTTTCTGADAIKAASYVLEYWHDQGICQILQAKYHKSQNPLRNAVSIGRQRVQSLRPQPNQELSIHLPYQISKKKCHRCLSLLKPMENAILQSWSSEQTYMPPKKSCASPGRTTLTTALDVHSKLLLGELIGYGSKLLLAQQIKANLEGVGLA